jgi:outer membrane protein, heavy metal efflux system
MLFRYLIVFSLVSPFAAAYSEPLTFEAALTLAEQSSSDIAAQTARVDAAMSASVAAGALPDPRLEVGIENLPVSGADQFRFNRDSMTMQKVGFLQEVPNAAVRRAEKAEASALIEQAEAQKRVRVLAVRESAALAWLNRYYIERRIALFDDLSRENQLFAQVVEAQLAGGRALPADSVAPKEEAADLADRLDALHAESLKSKAALRRLLGEPGAAPLAGEPPPPQIDAEHFRTHVHTHPELEAYAPVIAGAQAAVHEAEAAKRPGWSVEVSYGRRAPEYSDMASVQFTWALPFFAGTRQDPLIAARSHELTRLESERDDMLRDHTEALDGELADYELATRQLARAREVRLPLAQQKVNYQLASYQGSKGDLAAVLQARRELIDARLMEITYEGQRATAAARITFSYPEQAP